MTTCRTCLTIVPHVLRRSIGLIDSAIARPAGGRAGLQPEKAGGAPMSSAAYERIRNNPKFKQLVETRNKLAIRLSLVMLAIYYGFILLVAFAPGLLGTPIGGSVITIGIPLGILVIVSAFVLTGVYVQKANTTFDQMNNEILKEAR
jgi:uncharacterized membrane protein (DUF485 family)